MNQIATQPAVRGAHPVAVANDQLRAREGEFAAALPPHIPVARFMRVVMTAIQRNPDLANADRTTLFNSALMAAQDGLLPDQREGALVIYNTKVKRNGSDVWIKAVQWMPMIAGILKKVRNSGELSSIIARVVYAGDKFRNWIDDEGEHIEYEPGENADLNIVRCAFAMAKLKDGSIEVEVLRPADIEKIRAVSKSKDKGPWVDWWEEMAKKSAIRRLAKRLPVSTDLDDVVRRDNDLYDFETAGDASVKPALRGAAATLAAIEARAQPSPALQDPAHDLSHDPETGEIIEQRAAEDEPAHAQAAGASSPEAPQPDAPAAESAIVATARQKTKLGVQRFGMWLKTLSEADTASLDGIANELFEAAKAADEAKKSAS